MYKYLLIAVLGFAGLAHAQIQFTVNCSNPATPIELGLCLQKGKEALSNNPNILTNPNVITNNPGVIATNPNLVTNWPYNSTELNRLEQQVRASYSRALSVSRDPQRLQADQRYWSRSVRNNCRDNVRCLSDAYHRRITHLERINRNPGQTGQGHYSNAGRCFWMENYSGRSEWVPAPRVSTKEACRMLDSCNGGSGRSRGGCYKWANSASGARHSW